MPAPIPLLLTFSVLQLTAGIFLILARRDGRQLLIARLILVNAGVSALMAFGRFGGEGDPHGDDGAVTIVLLALMLLAAWIPLARRIVSNAADRLSSTELDLSDRLRD